MIKSLELCMDMAPIDVSKLYTDWSYYTVVIQLWKYLPDCIEYFKFNQIEL